MTRKRTDDQGGSLGPTERSRVRRVAERGRYERQALYEILDAGLVAHVGFAVDGVPWVIPMAYGRDGDRLVLHGSVASRLVRTLADGVAACVTVTLLDGLVLARSVFHHSMNYRSVVLAGTARAIVDEADKRRALDVLTEHLVAGRAAEAREPSRQELAATEVLAFPITEGSAKVRQGPPRDAKGDLELPVWAGVVPLELRCGVPQPDAGVGIESPVPDSVKGLLRRFGGDG